ncbi:hypothetical protein C6362_07260 [Megasphaera elsdenii DSM 20460]|nr:hypothetical protein C6362_07260 [Megasphaera elsdenii DSM 20460]
MRLHRGNRQDAWRLDKSSGEALITFGGWPYIRLPIAGGNWNNGSNAGVFALNVNNRRSNANGNIGFRSALLRTSEGAALRGYAQYTKK